MNRRWRWGGAAIAGAALLGVSAWMLRPRPEVQVESARVTTGPIARRILATGTVQAVTTVDVGSQVSGTVQSLDADFNSIVRSGEVIARLDPSLIRAALEQARAVHGQSQAALEQAHADLSGLRTAEEDARIKLARAVSLDAGQLIPKADLDAAEIAMNEATADVKSGEARVAQTRAEVARAKASVDQAAVDLDHTVIRSPIDGIVVARKVDVGQTVAAAVQAPVLFSIAADFTHVQVQVDIDESDVGGLTPGEPASFQVESYPDQTFRGTVTQVRLQPVSAQTTTAAGSTGPPASSVVGTVVNYTAVIAVENPDERLRPGMTAEVALGGMRRDGAVRIPNRALAFRPPPDVLRALGEAEPATPDTNGVSDNSGARPSDVWEYDGKRFTPIVVHTGLADDQWTELLSGSIHAGDTLVTSAVLRLRSRL
jgi:HlyD family secretion protein